MEHPQRDKADLQKRIAAQCNDAAWTLIERPGLDAAALAELLTLAATARHHWHEVGLPGNVAHSDLLFSWALARAGIGPSAVLIAGKALSHFEESGATWERAFAHAAMAAACGADRDAAGLRKHYSEAEELGAELSGQDATYFQAAFKTVSQARQNEAT